MTRAALIDAGKVWTVSNTITGTDTEVVLFETYSRARCLAYLKVHNLTRQYKAGKIRIGKIIWEPETK